MTTPTYYTPEIEEFCVGFVYQSKNNAQEEFQTYVVESDFDSCVYQHLIDSGELRVKYLDREDIEGEGWKFLGAETYKLDETHRLTYYPESLLLTVEVGEFETAEWRFYGTIRNLTEFRKLMKQLGIKK